MHMRRQYANHPLTLGDNFHEMSNRIFEGK